MSRRALGRVVLVVSGLGFPLTQLAIDRFGRAGAIVVEAVSVGLLARGAALVASGTAMRLRRGPAILLWLEAGVAGLATLAGLPLLISGQARRRAIASQPTPVELVRRGAIGTLFGLHTWRFYIYLQPDHGRSGALARSSR